MSGDTRAITYPRLNGVSLANVDGGAALYAAWDQLFFQAFTATVTADLSTSAATGLTFTHDLSTSAALTTTVTRDLSTSGVVSRTVTTSLTSDAALVLGHTRDLSSGAVLTTTDVAALTSGAVLTTTDVAALTTAAVIAFSKTRDLGSSAAVAAGDSASVSSGAVIQVRRSRDVTTDAATGANAYYDLNTLAVLSRTPARDLLTDAAVRALRQANLSSSAAVDHAPKDLLTTAVITVTRQLETLTRAAVFNFSLVTLLSGRLVDVHGRPVAGAQLTAELAAGPRFAVTPSLDGHLVALRPVVTTTDLAGAFSFQLVRPDRFPMLPTRYLLTGPGVRLFFRLAGVAPSFIGGAVAAPTGAIQTCVVAGSVHDLAGSSRGSLSVGYGQGRENLLLQDGTIVSLLPGVVEPAADGSFSVTLIVASQFAVA